MKKIFIIITTCIFLSNCSKLNFFGFGEKKNKFKKYEINEYLWKSSESFLSKYPNVESDLQEGLISTDWIVSAKNPDTRIRITVYILGSNITHKNIKVITDKERNVNGTWIQANTSILFNENLQKIIISKAQKLESENY